MTAIMLEIEGFESQRIEVKPAGLFSGRKLLVNGEPAPKGPKRGQMILTQDNGQEVAAQWRSSLGNNALEVNGKTIPVGIALKWYEWALMASPAALAATGIMGWLFAALAMGIGYWAFLSQKSPTKKVLTWAGGFLFAFALNILLGIVVALLV